MSDAEKDALLAFIKFAKQFKKGHVALSPKNGKAPQTVTFDKKKVQGKDIAHGTFRFESDKLFLSGKELKQAHVDGLTKTLRPNGLSKYDVELEDEG